MHRATTNQLTLSISRHFVPQFKAGQYVLDHLIIFNMRQSYCTRYSYRLDVCLSVCLPVGPSHAGIVSKRLNLRWDGERFILQKVVKN